MPKSTPARDAIPNKEIYNGFMSAPYTLRKTKSGPRMMTLSKDMMARMEAAPIDAVRLTLDLTFKAIRELTGEQVVLAPAQQDLLSRRLDEPELTESAEAFRVWRWITQGARARDTQDMGELLKVATAAVHAVRSIDLNMRDPSAEIEVDDPKSNEGKMDTSPPFSSRKSKP